jgi:hypothetical protein
MAGHRFVFVGGLPQSGTSVLRQLLLLPKSASGQDSCKHSTNCRVSNVEGQWLLQSSSGSDSGDYENDRDYDLLRHFYGPGKEGHFLTEANFTTAAKNSRYSSSLSSFRRQKRSNSRGDIDGGGGEHRGDSSVSTEEIMMMRRYLWSSWSRFWAVNERPFLVEKSPTNLVKLRWLAAVFKGDHSASGSSSVSGSVGNSTAAASSTRSSQEGLAAAGTVATTTATTIPLSSSSSSSSSSLRWPRLSNYLPPTSSSFPRFVMVVRDPTSNSHFFEPRHCADYAK